MKKVIGLLFVFGLCLGHLLTAQMPEPFPGAVLVGPDRPTTYLTRATVEQVADFFGRQLGLPVSSGYPYHFIYATRQVSPGITEDTGVWVSVDATYRSATHRILTGHLAELVRFGGITWEQIAALQEESRDVARLFFQDDGSGMAADVAILSRYENFLDTGIWHSPEEIERRMQDMAVRGDRAGLNALLNEIIEGGERALPIQNDPVRRAEHWITCLEEIRRVAPEYGFPVLIEMVESRQYSEGDKG